MEQRSPGNCSLGKFQGLQSKYLSSYCNSNSLKVQISFLFPSNWCWGQYSEKKKEPELKSEDLDYSITKQLQLFRRNLTFFSCAMKVPGQRILPGVSSLWSLFRGDEYQVNLTFPYRVCRAAAGFSKRKKKIFKAFEGVSFQRLRFPEGDILLFKICQHILSL